MAVCSSSQVISLRATSLRVIALKAISLRAIFYRSPFHAVQIQIEPDELPALHVYLQVTPVEPLGPP